MAKGHGRVRNRTNLSTRKVRHPGPSRDASGCSIPLTHEVLGPTALAKRAKDMHEKRKIRLQEMTVDERRALEALRELPIANDDNRDHTFEDVNIEDILDGSEPLNISHAGGEFIALTEELNSELWKNQYRRIPRQIDYRTRRDRQERRDRAFNRQMDALVDAYLVWSLDRAENHDAGFFTRLADWTRDASADSGCTEVTVVDIFTVKKISLPILPTDRYVASAFVRQGVMPCSPIAPTVGITTDALELYRVAHLRNPHFSIQAFVKTLCDLHTVPFRRHLSRQFSIAFDLYLAIRADVDKAVHAALHRSSPDWRLKHACPACMYKLKDEDPLLFSMLYTQDGNDSLRRVVKRSPSDEDGKLGPSSELPTARQVKGDRYLSREYVNKWANRELQNATAVADDLDKDPDSDTPCGGRWKNMNQAILDRMWGVFDETGIFLALCRHGFSLLIADMVRSGELAKYPLAITEKLLDAFGDRLGGGYDIGCKFKTTLNNSSLGARARLLHHTSLVGAFHGHAHQRLCQLSHLATYVKGLGLEDLEGCERAFSQSNALAPAIRYASVFHRQQAIATYFEHHDNFEIYANLTTFLFNNYKQALDILSDGEVALPLAMANLNITDRQVFELWLAEEKEYLVGLQKEPEEETLQMEYWQKLVNLRGSEKDLASATPAVWDITTPGTHAQDHRDTTRATETTRRHAVENYEKDLKAVQVLELRLDIQARWMPTDLEWQNAGRLVAMRKYQRALDTLEGLIVARMFELTKMNRSQTGYALRKHIGKALQARSSAIRTALEKYNASAASLSPPRRTLEWKEVVEYAFLADFDLLRDTRQDISQRPWATPAGRLAMDMHFKMHRAEEEIQRLNIEIRRVATYLRDETSYLHACEEQVRPSNAALAYQISVHRLQRGRFNSQHVRRLQDIAKLRGFNGTISPGHSDATGLGESASRPLSVPTPMPASPMTLDPPEDIAGASRPGNSTGAFTTDDASPDEEQYVTDTLEELERDEDEDSSVEEVSQALYTILHVSGDE
ncbi:hypothetical protein PLICRDRAFT_383096 [Plicaturopsis crispa FD-325 SS-3]|nr:hypothetical protein PLICRDRAFT_383096 [Plicaturopsis crispa FD-325 SS-3]